MNTSVNTLTLREAGESDWAWVYSEHCRHYLDVEQFDPVFTGAVAGAIAAFRTHYKHTVNRAFILAADTAPVGSLLLSHEESAGNNDRSARLRLFYLAPHTRNKGQGRRLLDAAVARASAHDYHSVRVSTYSAHSAACALYANYGFVLERECRVTAWGRQLSEQHWVLAL